MTEPTDGVLAALRGRAVAVAYRMLGSRSDAEDVAQTTMLRVREALDHDDLRSPEAFTTTVATRLSIDHLRSARVRRESYVGPWLPEPVATGSDPATDADLADDVSFAFLVVLESLGPVERAAFLLHDTFGYGYPELTTILGRTEDSCRQLVARARRRLAERRPRFDVDDADRRELLGRFVDAARTGAMEQLVELLAPDATLVSDGGAHRKAARRPIVGRDRVVTFVRKIGPKFLTHRDTTIEVVNGEPAFVAWEPDGSPYLVGTVEVTDGLLRNIRWVSNPDKLGWVGERRLRS